MTRPHGPIFPFALVERWINEQAQMWFPDYLAEAERQNGFTPRYFAPVKSFVTANEWDNWPEEHLPCLLVMDTGLGEQPRRQGAGRWSARRLYSASVITQGPTRSDVRMSTSVYGAALRSLLLQHQDLGHPERIGGLDWTDERPAPIPNVDERNIGAQIALFVVDVKDVADEGGVPRGPQFPDEPLEDPYTTPPPDLPSVEEPGSVPPDTDPNNPDQPMPGESRITIRTRSIQ